MSLAGWETELPDSTSVATFEPTEAGWRWSDTHGRQASIDLSPADGARELGLRIERSVARETNGVAVFDITPSGTIFDDPAVVCIRPFPESGAPIPDGLDLRVITSEDGVEWEPLLPLPTVDPAETCGLARHLSLFTVAKAAAETPESSGSSGASATFPERAFQIRPSAWFFERKDPGDFQIARTESFADMSDFRRFDLYYTIHEGLDTVWEQYKTINPLRIWSNNRAYLTAVYVPSLDRVLYRSELGSQWTGFEEGMNVFIDMASRPFPVSNKPAIMVGLRIVTIDEQEKRVVFRYLEGSPSYGEQVITFAPSVDDPATTDISHETWFLSYGEVIGVLYPMYHKLMIDSMHDYFGSIIEANGMD